MKKTFKKIIAVAILLAIWQGAAMLLNKNILLASPMDVVVRLITMPQDAEFLKTIAFSFIRIAGGFVLALIAGIVLAILAARWEWAEIILSPIMLTVKTVPVASFIVLALIWISSGKLSAFISFLMVLPVIYNNVLRGIKSIDKKMNQMADVYRLSWKKRFKYIWIPAIEPFVMGGCETALGLAWKAGVAAEVIGIPEGSIGERIYMSKVYFDTADLFAWTVIIVLISALFEKLVLWLLRLAYSRFCK